jgi:hypothetical protein
MNARIYASGNIGIIEAGLARDTEAHKLTPRIGPKYKKFEIDPPTSKAKPLPKAATITAMATAIGCLKLSCHAAFTTPVQTAMPAS